MPLAKVFQPLKVYPDLVKVFDGRVVLTPLATVTLEIEPDPELALKEIVLGTMECAVTVLGALELLLFRAITRKSYEVEFESPVMVVLVPATTTD